MEIRLKVSKKLSPKIQESIRRIRFELQSAVNESLEIIKKDAEQNIISMFKTRTGKGRRAPQIEKARIFGNKIRGIVGIIPRKSQGYYMKFHETGAIIRAKRKPYLAIPHPDGGIRRVKQVILSKKQWLKPAVDKNERAIMKILIEATRKALN